MYQRSCMPRNLHNLLTTNFNLITSTFSVLSTLRNSLTLHPNPTAPRLHSWNFTLSEIKNAYTQIISTISQISSSLSVLQTDLELAVRLDVGEELWGEISGPIGNALVGEETEGIPGPLLAQRADIQIPGACSLRNLQAQVNTQRVSAEELGGWLEKVGGELAKLAICE